MVPYTSLSPQDIEVMDTWIRDYGASISVSMDIILNQWNQAKQQLWETVFNHQLILKRPVQYEVSQDEIFERMEEVISYWNCSGIRPIKKIVSGLYGVDNVLAAQLSRFLDLEDWCNNIYTGDTFFIPEIMTLDQKPFKIEHGCKIMKTLGKLYSVLGLSESDYEQVRQAHSMVLNQKIFHGNLCLSIHPMDYMTMSDNDCNWTSCMRWRQDEEEGTVGEYRLGTIEMMNSPCVVVAYLEAAEDMFIYPSYYWNSKKWRMLMIVKPEIIIANREYPYGNSLLQEACLNWMREICQNCGFGKYNDTIYQVGNNNVLRIGETVIKTHFRCNYMYNDINSAKDAFIDEEYFLNLCNPEYFLNFSGVATCMGCGAIIPYSVHAETSSVGCYECMGYEKCSHCSGWFDPNGEGSYDDDDNFYCDNCWDELTEGCDNCRNWYIRDQMKIYPILHGARPGEVCLCQWCDDNKIEQVESKFGPRLYDEINQEFYFDKDQITDMTFLRRNNL